MSLLPFEKEISTEPTVQVDFSSLDVVAWGGTGLPSGINLPNYNDIREKEGFKNVIFERDMKKMDKKDFELMEHFRNSTKGREESDLY